MAYKCALIAILSGAVLCELMNDDGTMSRFPHIVVFVLKHDLMVLSIEDIIEYRQMHPSDNLLEENILQ
ncbi:3,4-dihydroxy-2-butanone-4-phosphate synthase [Chryseobacterium bernardetii]|uniref:3,4-dihydroxy-2-butanone-4-phosphate synthase n=1 Tax=Chryseobacterium bernardetii TaxID=1241978 RepID=UPI00293BCE9A|nr:3,4-dihydroxy-2-butanone-4-phosphate synthase [Chryseobacterium bernardetii]